MQAGLQNLNVPLKHILIPGSRLQNMQQQGLDLSSILAAAQKSGAVTETTGANGAKHYHGDGMNSASKANTSVSGGVQADPFLMII